MDISSENIIINSCQYTPVYLIENPSVSEPSSYIITQNEEIYQRPASDNLKKFYENSGKLENNLLGSTESGLKPRVLKKVEGNLVGNNLKLASFLIPKNENPKQNATISTNSIVLKPVVVPNSSSLVQTVPQMDISRRIVKIKDIPKGFNTSKILPKIKPKENPNASKHTSVQLLKLGETYHSLNELSDDQVKIVNHALKIFSNPQKKQEPTYDPVTNTKFIYKVVSPKDLTVVGKNKVLFKQKKNELRKESIRKVERKEIKYVEEVEEQKSPITETKVTRSGRKVKLPKNILPETDVDTQRPRKKSGTIVSCFQCLAEFSSLYRLQRHYENHPTHIPARIHSNLFHCLLAIVKGGSEEDGANIFLQQLEQLIAKLKSLLPCLLTRTHGVEGKQSTINDDVSRLFGMVPGKYNLNIDALSCVKNKDGFCRHNPQPPLQPTSNPSLVLNGANEDINEIEMDTDDCARITSAEKWPTVSKRMEARKTKSDTLITPENSNPKRMKLTTDIEPHIDIGIDDIVAFLNCPEKTNITIASHPSIDENSSDVQIIADRENPVDKVSRPAHVQFHSAHFDIRSSPIKPSSTIFRKFKIDPEKIARYEPQIIRPPSLIQDNNSSFSLSPEEVVHENCNSLQAHDIFNEEISLPCKDAEELTFDSAKTWTVADQPDYLKPSTLNDESSDSYIKPSALIEPALLHIKDPDDKTDTSASNHNHEVNDSRLMPNSSQSVLTFLDSFGNSVDFHLDLFS